MKTLAILVLGLTLAGCAGEGDDPAGPGAGGAGSEAIGAAGAGGLAMTGAGGAGGTATGGTGGAPMCMDYPNCPPEATSSSAPYPSTACPGRRCVDNCSPAGRPTVVSEKCVRLDGTVCSSYAGVGGPTDPHDCN